MDLFNALFTDYNTVYVTWTSTSSSLTMKNHVDQRYLKVGQLTPNPLCPQSFNSEALLFQKHTSLDIYSNIFAMHNLRKCNRNVCTCVFRCTVSSESASVLLFQFPFQTLRDSFHGVNICRSVQSLLHSKPKLEITTGECEFKPIVLGHLQCNKQEYCNQESN